MRTMMSSGKNNQKENLHNNKIRHFKTYTISKNHHLYSIHTNEAVVERLAGLKDMIFHAHHEGHEKNFMKAL